MITTALQKVESGGFLQPSASGTEAREREQPSPALLYLAGLKSRRTPTQILREVAHWLEPGTPPGELAWHRIDYSTMVVLRERIELRCRSVGTARRWMSVVKSVLQVAWSEGLMSTDQYHRAIKVKPFEGKTMVLAGRRVLEKEARWMVKIAGPRDRVILLLGLHAGLRRNEQVHISWPDDFDLGEDGEGMLTVTHGKKGTIGQVPVSDSLRRSIDAWLEVRGREPGYLLSSNGGGPLSSQTISDVVTRVCGKAKVARCSPTDLRRHYVTECLERGVPLDVVQRLARHSNPATTLVYSRRNDRAMLEGVRCLPSYL